MSESAVSAQCPPFWASHLSVWRIGVVSNRGHKTPVERGVVVDREVKDTSGNCNRERSEIARQTGEVTRHLRHITHTKYM